MGRPQSTSTKELKASTAVFPKPSRCGAELYCYKDKLLEVVYCTMYSKLVLLLAVLGVLTLGNCVLLG